MLLEHVQSATLPLAGLFSFPTQCAAERSFIAKKTTLLPLICVCISKQRKGAKEVIIICLCLLLARFTHHDDEISEMYTRK